MAAPISGADSAEMWSIYPRFGLMTKILVLVFLLLRMSDTIKLSMNLSMGLSSADDYSSPKLPPNEGIEYEFWLTGDAHAVLSSKVLNVLLLPF